MRRAWHALAAYLVITLVATWPLVTGLGRDIPWDLGDPVMVTWVIAWDCEQMLQILRGDFGRLATFFDANIFHPAPLTLAYSEHLVAQAIQVLPIYALTHNPILCYDLLFLGTFVLSGFGTYLFVRELTGSGPAAFVAGLIFAFSPYRIPQSSHLQVLSSQWMPLALYGFRRYFESGRRRPLAGAAGALVMQNLSCGYYLLYFSPFAGAYVAWEMTQRQLWRSAATWRHLISAAVVVLALTVPFLLPYAAVRDQLQLGRSTSEVVRYSADVYSYLTAFSEQPVWGTVMHAFPKAEGDLFPGIVPVLLALAGLGAAWLTARRSGAAIEVSRRRSLIASIALVLAGVHAFAAVAVALLRRINLDLGLFTLRMSDANQLLVRAAILLAIGLAVSARARGTAARLLQQRGFALLSLVAAMWLSLGPIPQALGRRITLAGPYALLYNYVPGFDGVRAPARLGMVAMLMLAVLAGYGAQLLDRRHLRPLLAVVAVLFLCEGLVLPFTINGSSPVRGYATPEPRLHRPQRAPAVYSAVASQPRDAVVAELPLGVPDYDLRAMYYSTVHWRRLLNGYSGFFPAGYGELTAALADLPSHPRIAFDALRAGEATLVVVHEGAYLADAGAATSAALRRLGLRELFRDGQDVLFAMP